MILSCARVSTGVQNLEARLKGSLSTARQGGTAHGWSADYHEK